MKYRTTRLADQDIIDLYGHGVRDFGVAQAERYIEGLFSAFELLADNPYIARERTELNPPTHLHPYGSHMIAYVVQDEGVLIVRVLHGRQDWQTLLS
ncbi:type II toxin-antitoxin system RelE/ParE family toxin [Sinorhizobium sp. RAC02]|uniref:type II toxin-antitoxin system RelE/ParE family toxin n=1 Tax=Sinorhizobium sp. RAC02 TaxID=1842534 RepID=UPI00083E0899|nr:type II toxin-antitoxin system RelE/ParE family toxin [Sinorhizobium sp. RAC02]AOF94237.1 plasmid stabilization system family protein [Sinorhizobium sp. RAC02]